MLKIATAVVARVSRRQELASEGGDDVARFIAGGRPVFGTTVPGFSAGVEVRPSPPDGSLARRVSTSLAVRLTLPGTRVVTVEEDGVCLPLPRVPRPSS